MKLQTKIFSTTFFLALGLIDPCFALKEEYERNGEAYMLIGEGPFRGVYNVNNHNSKGIQKLYDPKDAYGLSVDKDRNLYTFASQDDSGFKPVAGDLERMVKRAHLYPSAPPRTNRYCWGCNSAGQLNLGDLIEPYHGPESG